MLLIILKIAFLPIWRKFVYKKLVQDFILDFFCFYRAATYDAGNDGSIELTLNREYDKGIMKKVKFGDQTLWQLNAMNSYHPNWRKYVNKKLVQDFILDFFCFYSAATYDAGNDGSIELTLDHEYDKGILKKVKFGDQTLWQLNAMNSYGQITSYTYGNGITTDITYDAQSRPFKIEAGNIFRWQYGFNAATGNLTPIWRKFVYKKLVQDFILDFFCFYSAATYDAGNDGSIELTLDHEYDKGILKKVKFGDQTLWQLNAMNSYGQITSYTYGNGITTDITYDAQSRPDEIKADNHFWYEYNFDAIKGNLTSRKNRNVGKQDNFTYDGLNRLKTYYDGSSEVKYSTNGNINSKTSAGYYSYNSIRKNAVETISSVDPGNGPLPEERSAASPDIHSDISTDPQNIDYNWFNKPTSISQGIYNYELSFGPDMQRKKMEVYENGTLVKTKYYSGNYEKIYDDNGDYKEYTYISAMSGLVAVYIKDSRGDEELKEAPGGEEFNYIHSDYLGSIMALTDENGNLEEEYHYDAWGRRRNPSDYSYTGFTTNLTNRGFTGHEHLDEVGLINMNGRTYDPILGRMLSPDNNIQMPDFSQNLNRYSYALNNPLVFTDPDGEFIFTALCLIIPGAQFLLPIAIGADIGAITGGIRGANNDDVGFWKGAARGAAVGAVGGGLSMIGGAGMPFITNLALGTGSGAITGGLDAALWGNDIGKGMLYGAAAGAVFTTLTSENFSNTLKGEGFYTNENVFNNMIERGMDKQAMLDYFGFGGTHDPDKLFVWRRWRAWCYGSCYR